MEVEKPFIVKVNFNKFQENYTEEALKVYYIWKTPWLKGTFIGYQGILIWQ